MPASPRRVCAWHERLLIDFFTVPPGDDEAFLAAWAAEGRGVLVRALRDDVQPRYASLPDAPAGGVVLLAPGAEWPAAFTGRQGFLGARVIDGVLVAHWSSPLMYARAVRAEGDLLPGALLYARQSSGWIIQTFGSQ